MNMLEEWRAWHEAQEERAIRKWWRANMQIQIHRGANGSWQDANGKVYVDIDDKIIWRKRIRTWAYKPIGGGHA